MYAKWTEKSSHNHSWSNEWSGNETHHWHNCTASDCDITDNSAKNSYGEHTGGTATCQAKKICSTCQKQYGSLGGHKPEHYAAQAATCTSNGYVERWFCSGCYNYFTSEACTTEIEDIVTARNPANHSGTAKSTAYDATYHWTKWDCCDAIDGTKEVHKYTNDTDTTCNTCGYEREIATNTQITNIAVTITEPALGATPDKLPNFTTNADSSNTDTCYLSKITWYKIAESDYTGNAAQDDWTEMKDNETFQTGYYYSPDIYLKTLNGYEISPTVTATLNGKAHYDEPGDEYKNNSTAYVCGIFDQLTSPPATSYTVTFNNNGHGTAPTAQNVESGNKAIKPTDLTADGWTFDGWYEDATFRIVYDFNKAVTSNITLYAKWTENSVTPPMIAIVEGNGSEWTKGTNSGLTFKSNANFADFVRVEIDGAEVATANYTKSEGSTVVTLKASYLKTLSVGNHTLDIVSTTGTASTTFTIKAAAGGNNGGGTAGGNTGNNTGSNTGNEKNPNTGTTSPQTGDSSNVFMWIALLFVSLGGLTTTVVYKKRKAAK